MLPEWAWFPIDLRRKEAMREAIARADGLARFRADPSKIRVGIRAIPGGWRATVENRVTGESSVILSKDIRPDQTIMVALELAKARGFDGIDLGMKWFYPHPQKKTDHVA